MDSRVVATVTLHAAQASKRVAELESAEKQIPLTQGTSNARLYASKRLKAARELADGWQTVMALVELEQRHEREGEQKRDNQLV